MCLSHCTTHKDSYDSITDADSSLLLDGVHVSNPSHAQLVHEELYSKVRQSVEVGVAMDKAMYAAIKRNSRNRQEP